MEGLAIDRLVLWQRILVGTDETAEPQMIATAVEESLREIERAGGTILGSVGGTVVALFDITDLVAAVEAGLSILAHADGHSANGAPQVAIGIALGAVETTNVGQYARLLGAAIDRAQQVANRARAGEIALDSEAAAAASVHFLFGRMVNAGGTLRARAIDRTRPRRTDCVDALSLLGATPIASPTSAALAPLQSMTKGEGVEVAVLRGPTGCGIGSFLSKLEKDTAPPIVLKLGTVPGGLEPHGSLRLALHRSTGYPDLEPPDDETLRRIVRGDAVDSKEAYGALRDWLLSMAGPKRAWIVLDSIATIDPSSLYVLGDLVRESAVRALVVVRLPVGGSLPAALVHPIGMRELAVPTLRSSDARQIAAAILGEPVTSDLARRVAQLGGDSVLGILEAARTLVASGDLAHDGFHFSWRVAPRVGNEAIPTEALIEERLAPLDMTPKRLLEIASIVPWGSPISLIHEVCTRDGLERADVEQAAIELRRQGFLSEEAPPKPTSVLLRGVVVQSMPPGRVAELRRFLGQSLRDRAALEGPFPRATAGYYLAEGGAVDEGVKALLETADVALTAGHSRAAVRLAAAAVQFSPARDTRAWAARISRQSSAGSRASLPAGARASLGPSRPSLARQAVKALLDHELDRVDRCVEVATAEGRDGGAARRVRAFARMLRGDHEGAMQALHERATGAPDVRDAIALAWVTLHGGDPNRAVRHALEALAEARRRKDARGEVAVLHSLAAFYRNLGREKDARTIAASAP